MIFPGLVLTLQILGGSAAGAEAPWRERLNQAERLAEEGKADEAAAAAESSLADARKSLGADAPELGPILALLSRVYAAGGHDEKLSEMEARLSAVKSKDFAVWYALGCVLRDEEKSAAAEAALQKALALRADDAAAEDKLSQVYEDMGRDDDVIALAKKRIAKDPGNHDLYAHLAGAYVRLGRVEEAKQAFAEFKKSSRWAAHAYVNEGYFYLQSGDLARAKEDLESAVAVDTASPFGYHHLGSYFTWAGQYPQAEKSFRQALEKLESDPNAGIDDLMHTSACLGDVIQAQGRYADAEAVYLKYLEKGPPGNGNQLHLLWSLGKTYVADGKSALAEKAYERAVAGCRERFKGRASLTSEALIELGQFYLGQGRRAEAEAMAAQADDPGEDVPTGLGLSYGNVLPKLASFYESLGDDSKREAIYGRTLALRRTEPYNHDLVWAERGLGDMDAKRGRFHEAEDHYRRAIEILEHVRYWKEEADALEALARIAEADGRSAAQEARERAKALRARP